MPSNIACWNYYRYAWKLRLFVAVRLCDSFHNICVLYNSSRSMCDSTTKCMNMKDLNPFVKQMKYAVRGKVLQRAEEIQKELKRGDMKSFSKIINANLGDGQAMGQLPITFIRQVLALICYPELMSSDASFPPDVVNKARTILSNCFGNSIGSYTESYGIEIVRKHCAEYIKKRDGISSDYKNIFLGSGASDCIKNLLKLFIHNIEGKKAGIMISVPQYPLYSATCTQFDLHRIPYFLDESKNWGLDISELERAIKEGKKVCYPRAIVIINPGNPTGQVLSKNDLEDLIKFAYKENLFILSDEVYQNNIYTDDKQFMSCKKVMMELGEPYSKMELASFFSCSKGYGGECGLRGGFIELVNVDPDVLKMFRNSVTVLLCSNALGQAAIDCVVDPPKDDDPSHEQYIKEVSAILESLKHRSKFIVEKLNSFEGFKCNEVQGALYAFPSIEIPPKAIEAAKLDRKPPDVFYCFQLLEKTGICVVPGSGFGQKPGTYHFRTTILPETAILNDMLEKFNAFHSEFIKTYK